MICEKCHQESATVYLNRIINGEKIEIHLCETCAKETKGHYINSDLSFQNLLIGLLDLTGNNKESNYDTNNTKQLKCSQCSMTYTEFRKKGKFGCAECYNAFLTYLPAVLKRIHGSNTHTGKIPRRGGEELLAKRQVSELEQKLQLAIVNEEFEIAAKLRDEIRTLKGSVEYD